MSRFKVLLVFGFSILSLGMIFCIRKSSYNIIQHVYLTNVFVYNNMAENKVKNFGYQYSKSDQSRLETGSRVVPEVEFMQTGNVSSENLTFDGVPVRIYIPSDRIFNGPAMLYIHGGGWIYGSIGLSKCYNVICFL
jgi:hypothetical protein